MIINKISLYRLKVPLTRPYKISSAEIKAYDLTLVCLECGGRKGIGEAMADVRGYFWETPDEVWQFARREAPRLPGLALDQARESLSAHARENPCAVTPFITAMEMISGPLEPPASGAEPVPMVAILQANDPEGIAGEVEEFISRGYSTIKAKVGFNVKSDIEKVRIAGEALRGKGLLRCDANQGYSFSEAKSFVSAVEPRHLEFLEQPFKEDDWESMIALSKISPVPLGLDESIYDLESVERARRLNCAKFIKFKLMKIGSAAALAGHIEKTRSYGFEVILGNGAAGEINCYHEALVASRMMTRAGEMNGFLKQSASILRTGLKTEGGKILLDPGFSPELDSTKVEKYAVDRMTIG